MAKPFTVNVNRFDPYKNYRFLVYFGETTSGGRRQQGDGPEAHART